MSSVVFFFFFQAEDGIRDYKVTGVQTCALPIYLRLRVPYAGGAHAVVGNTQPQIEDAIRAGKPVVTEDALLLARSEQVDVLVDVTGAVEFGARVALEAFEHGKDVVLMNAEIDATIGPILQTYAAKHGVILSACEGDEPGLQLKIGRAHV